MPRLSAAQQPTANTTPAPTDEVLFKPDRPRHIDRFIDYFGTTATSAASDHAFPGSREDDES